MIFNLWVDYPFKFRFTFALLFGQLVPIHFHCIDFYLRRQMIFLRVPQKKEIDMDCEQRDGE